MLEMYPLYYSNPADVAETVEGIFKMMRKDRLGLQYSLLRRC